MAVSIEGVPDSVRGWATVLRPDLDRIGLTKSHEKGEPLWRNRITLSVTTTPREAHFLAKNGQALLPMVELIEESKMALDELIVVLVRPSFDGLADIRKDIESQAHGNRERMPKCRHGVILEKLPDSVSVGGMMDGEWKPSAVGKRLGMVPCRYFQHIAFFSPTMAFPTQPNAGRPRKKYK